MSQIFACSIVIVEKQESWERGGSIRITLIVIQHVALVVSPAVVGFPDGHGVVGEVDIAVVALWQLVLALLNEGHGVR